ncbi:threonine ammonia-lyase [Bauldia litoralis]|uniref:L-threonine ammonia-lyase n=1 Tax=Bauldia litoralis TaxID=665467 RepID=A0A1G6D7X7_9HYPH|nr:threonine/serine dehydratase [Bauldia litoralis]SDB41253.1 L-threonine ammonia-lyase [Bauldia litoralis]
MSEPALPSIHDIHRARDRIAGHAVQTPLLVNPILDARLGGRILLKCETLQRTGSFKFRGACNAVSALGEAGRARGVVAASSGNHAQGVAEAARLFGVAATIVMPSDAPAIKLERTRRSGATVVTYDRVSGDRDAVAREIVERTGGALIHPFNNADVIAGQGTVGLEIVDEARARGLAPDAVVVPCSGGGLSAGVGLAVRDGFPDCGLVLVEPRDFDDYGRSLRDGRIVANASTSGSICDALMAPAPGSISFALNRDNVAAAVTVDDDDVLSAIAFAFRELKLVVEPGGAVALAALLSGKVDCRDRTVVAVLSGGNIDEAILARALATG